MKRPKILSRSWKPPRRILLAEHQAVLSKLAKDHDALQDDLGALVKAYLHAQYHEARRAGGSVYGVREWRMHPRWAHIMLAMTEANGHPYVSFPLDDARNREHVLMGYPVRIDARHGTPELR